MSKPLTGFNMGDKLEVFGGLKTGDTFMLKGDKDLKSDTKVVVKIHKLITNGNKLIAFCYFNYLFLLLLFVHLTRTNICLFNFESSVDLLLIHILYRLLQPLVLSI